MQKSLLVIVNGTVIVTVSYLCCFSYSIVINSSSDDENSIAGSEIVCAVKKEKSADNCERYTVSLW